MSTQHLIRITADGELVCAYDEALVKALDPEGRGTIQKAGYIETTDSLPEAARIALASRNIALVLNRFWASLLPLNGPVLGPFTTRTQALEAEAAWVRKYLESL
jgi:hypothetical protein